MEMLRYPLLPTQTDDYPTETSKTQLETEDCIISLLLPFADHRFTPQSLSEISLDRQAHSNYLIRSLISLPGRLTVLDASRPWLMYWILNSFSLLNLGLNPSDRQRALDTLLSFQHPQGGFAGTPGQLPHLAPTYSAISTIASLLGEADPETVTATWARVDVRAMYHWILNLKQPNGSFVMQENGEVDVRATYCALVVASLLNFLTPDLARGLPEFIAGCQTYEGGLASASQAHRSTLLPLGEAHGGYTSCGLLAHFLLESLSESIKTVPLDYEACLRWLTSMQALPIEGGGFRGRTNKLVDGCYSWWCAGLFPVLVTLIGTPSHEALYDRQALQEYILLISQAQGDNIPGGLRDKPSTQPDHYHTHYILAGLSAAQHSQHFSSEQEQLGAARFDLRQAVPSLIGTQESPEQAIRRARRIYSRALAWELLPDDSLILGQPANALIPVHPVFNIRPRYVQSTMDHFYLKA